MRGKVSTEKRGYQRKISPIEVRMRADMAARGYSPLTQAFYARAVRHLARHYAGHSLEQISVAEAQSYLRLSSLDYRNLDVWPAVGHRLGPSILVVGNNFLIEIELAIPLEVVQVDFIAALALL